MTRFARLACLAALAALPLTAAPALAQLSDSTLIDLSSKVSGLLDINTPQARLVLSEVDHGVANTWMLGVGEEYADGWTLASVAQNAFTMEKDGVRRQVPVNMVARNTGGASTQLALNNTAQNAPLPPGLAAGLAASSAPPQNAAGRGGGQGGRGAGQGGRGGGGGRGQPSTTGNFGLFQGGRGLIAPTPPPAPPTPPPPPPGVLTENLPAAVRDYVLRAGQAQAGVVSPPPLAVPLAPNATVRQVAPAR